MVHLWYLQLDDVLFNIEEITLDNIIYFLDSNSQLESYRYVLKTNHVTLTTVTSADISR